MGEALYAAARAEVPDLPPVRVYAPVGTHEDLLPYLVRRLLENGANSSFVHQFSIRRSQWSRWCAIRITSVPTNRRRRHRACASRARCLAPSAPTPRARTSAIRRRSRRSRPKCALHAARDVTPAARYSSGRVAARCERAGHLARRHARDRRLHPRRERRGDPPPPWKPRRRRSRNGTRPRRRSAPRAWSRPRSCCSSGAGSS